MLTLYRGDDYAGQLGKKLTIHLSIDAGLPIEGLKAVLEFYDIKKEFTTIQYENDFTVEVSHNQSKKYPLGVSYAKLYCVDSSGKIRTFCNRIPICVTTDLRKVYGSDGLDKQDVHVYALVHWDNIAGKPDYFPTTIEAVEGLEEALRQAGKVKTVNNIEPDENGNIQIDIPSAKVVSVNGKDGIVILNAGDIGYGEDSTVDSALAEAAARAANAISVANSKLSADDVVPETIANGVKIATIGGKEIKAPQGGGGGEVSVIADYKRGTRVASIGGKSIFTPNETLRVIRSSTGNAEQPWSYGVNFAETSVQLDYNEIKALIDKGIVKLLVKLSILGETDTDDNDVIYYFNGYQNETQSGYENITWIRFSCLADRVNAGSKNYYDFPDFFYGKDSVSGDEYASFGGLKSIGTGELFASDWAMLNGGAVIGVQKELRDKSYTYEGKTYSYLPIMMVGDAMSLRVEDSDGHYIWSRFIPIRALLDKISRILISIGENSFDITSNGLGTLNLSEDSFEYKENSDTKKYEVTISQTKADSISENAMQSLSDAIDEVFNQEV